MKKLNETFSYSNNSYRLDNLDDVYGNLINNLTDADLDRATRTFNAVCRFLGTKTYGYVYVISTDVEYDIIFDNADDCQIRADLLTSTKYLKVYNYYSPETDDIVIVREELGPRVYLYFNSEEKAINYINSVDKYYL